MAFNKPVPQWHAAGTEPPESLKTSGFTGGYQPPADFFNWFWHGVSEALAELQNHAAAQPEANLALYTDFAQIGLTVGSETISGIANALPNNSMLVTATGQQSADIYPNGVYGLLVVNRYAANRILFRWTQKDNASDFVGFITDGVWSGWKKAAVEYTSLTQIGLTEGSETIEAIVNAMVDGSTLTYPVSTSSASIYPANYGLVTVKRLMSSRVEFNFLGTSNLLYHGIYNSTATTAWSGWAEIYDENNKPTPADIGAAASSHTHAAGNIKAGTFADTAVKAKAGTDYTTERVRNIVMTSTDPGAGTSSSHANGTMVVAYE